MMTSVYKKLAIDLLKTCDLGLDKAERIVKFLQNYGLVDYDTLKEYYSDDEDEDENDAA